MSYSIETLDGCKKKFVFNFETVDLTPEVKTTLMDKQKSVSLKGFRKGKAPIGMIEKMYGPQAENDALLKFIQNQLIAAVEKEGMRTIGYPKFDNTEYKAEKKSIKFDVTVETFPEFEIKSMEGLSFTADKVVVEDKDLAELKERYLAPKAEMIAVEDQTKPIEKGQFAVINFEGEKEGGEKPENMKAEEYVLEIGSNSFIPGFEDKIIGMKAGEKKTIEITFPSDYQEASLQNAPVKFHVDLLEIKVRKLPELNDELAKEFGYDSLADFNEKNQKTLEAQKKRQTLEKLHQEILEKLVEQNPFDIPDALVEQRIQDLQEDLKQNLKMQGFGEDMMGDYFDKWKEDVREKAAFQVKSGLILNQLAENFKIETTDKDLEAKYQEMAEQSGMKIDEVKNVYGNNEKVRQNLNYALREEKTFEKIKDIVTVN